MKKETTTQTLFEGGSKQNDIKAFETKTNYLPTIADVADFQAKLFEKPNAEYIEKTPDGKAETLVISHIETRLDEIYNGLWSVSNFRWQQIANEIVGSLTLKVLHPICGVWIEREGAAAIQIMVDKYPEGLQGYERNLWANDIKNKKPNSLYLAFPKLKAECLKNAAKSLGETFGRSLNRKLYDATYEPEINRDEDTEIKEEILKLLETCTLPEQQKDGIRKLLTSDVIILYSRLVGIRDAVMMNQIK